MATDAERIAQLENALASPAAEIEYDGKRIKRREASEILASLRYFQAKEIAAAGRPLRSTTAIVRGAR